MQASGNLEQQPIRRCGTDARTEALRPGGQLLECVHRLQSAQVEPRPELLRAGDVGRRVHAAQWRRRRGPVCLHG